MILCYNCGSSHLPQPCTAPINRCDICGNHGHVWYFCHMGARLKDPNFIYHFLCANCNKWHLPIPCMSPIVQCGQCDEYGHLENLCPVNPLPYASVTTGIKIEDGAVKPAKKRQRTTGGRMAVAPVQISAEQIQSIRLQAAQEAVDYLKSGAEPSKVLQFIGMAPMMALVGQSLPDISKVGGSVVNSDTGRHIVEYDSPYNDKKVIVSKTLPSTMSSNAAPPISSVSHDTDDSPLLRVDNIHHDITEKIIHDFFNTKGPVASVVFGSKGTAFVTYVDSHHARLAQSTLDGAAVNGVPMQITTVPVPAAAVAALSPPITGAQYASPMQSFVQQDTPQPVKKVRQPSRPRCPACKLKKKRCTHIVPDELSPLLDGGAENASQGMPDEGLASLEQPFQEIQSHGNDSQAEWLKDAADKMHSQ